MHLREEAGVANSQMILMIHAAWKKEPWETCLSITILLYAIGCLFSEIALLLDLLISRVPNKIESATQPSLGLVFCRIKCLICFSYQGKKNGPNNDQSLQ